MGTPPASIAGFGLAATLVIMSGFQLLASLVSTLVWPVVVIAVAIFLWLRRAEIARLMPRTTDGKTRPLRRVKAGPLEFEWEQLVVSTALQADQLAAEPVKPIVSSDLYSLALQSPTTAILDAFARVEITLRRLLRVEGNPGWRRKNIYELGTEAFRRGLISSDTQAMIRNLIQLRNIAAHRLGESDVNSEDANDYLKLVDHVMAMLDDRE